MIRGSCLCGGIHYEISGGLHDMHFCHCSMCRKAHVASKAPWFEITDAMKQYPEESD